MQPIYSPGPDTSRLQQTPLWFVWRDVEVLDAAPPQSVRLHACIRAVFVNEHIAKGVAHALHGAEVGIAEGECWEAELGLLRDLASTFAAGGGAPWTMLELDENGRVRSSLAAATQRTRDALQQRGWCPDCAVHHVLATVLRMAEEGLTP